MEEGIVIEEPAETPPGKLETIIGFNGEQKQHKNLVDVHHPESSARIQKIWELRDRRLNSEDQHLKLGFNSIDEGDLRQTHSQKLIESLARSENMTQEDRNSLAKEFDSVFLSPGSNKAAREAVECCRDLAEDICLGKQSNGFAIVRPPGHHADKDSACGFCLFNNAAQAAEQAFNLGMDRVLIVDLDVHHGQGTQRIFYEEKRVLYFSIHRYQNGSFWPHLEESNYDYIGEGEGRGYNVNVPLNETGCTDADYLAIFWNVLWPLAMEYNPQFVIISAGFDSCCGDPLGQMELTPDCYAHMVYHLKALAGGKILMVLEGGYNHQVTAEGVERCIRVLEGAFPAPIPLDKPHKTSTVSSCLNVINQLKNIWKCFSFYNTTAGTATFSLPLNLDKFDTGDESARSNTTNIDQATLEEYKSEILPNYPKKSNYLTFVDNEFSHYIETATSHVENPQRVQKIHKKLIGEGLVESCEVIPPALGKDLLTQEEVEQTHERPYLEWLKRLSQMDPAARKGIEQEKDSIYLCHSTWAAAHEAASTVAKAVDRLLSEENRSRPAKCFAAVRPPGHHANCNNPSGFCFLNNVAIAANRAISKHGLKRILILDWDIHHGDGTQDIFEESSEVLYISLHRHDGGFFFPMGANKDHSYVGKERGKGYTVNIPWSYDDMGDAEYLAAFYKVVMPIAYQFNPELVIISAGFDAANGDPLGGYKVNPPVYSLMAYQLSALAGGKVLAVLEGGYHLAALADSAAAVVETFVKNRPSKQLNFGKLKSVSSLALTALRQVLSVQAEHWHCIKDFQLVGEMGYPFGLEKSFADAMEDDD